MDNSYVSLHTHTVYSLRDGLSKLDEMCSAVAVDGQPGLAVTDHGSLGASWKFQAAADRAGIHPIFGVEAYLAIEDGQPNARLRKATRPKRNATRPKRNIDQADDPAHESRYYHLTVLAETSTGWSNLLKIQNAAHDDGAFWTRPRADMTLLGEFAEGLIVLTGCLSGPIKSRLADGDIAGANTALGDLCDLVGHEQVYVEVMQHGIAHEDAMMPELIKLAKRHQLPVVATNDSHFTHQEDAVVHDAWLCNGSTGMTLASPGRWKFSGSGYHLRSTAEMRAIFDDEPGTENAVNNTLRIMERCTAQRVIPESRLRLPIFDPNGDSVAILRDKVRTGAVGRYGDPLPEHVRQRLNDEFRVIKERGLADYFLIVSDMIDWSRTQGYRVGPGRGSAAGSCVSYSLGIVSVDPIRFGLLFERFLSPDRVGMPDIDTDFENAARSRVIDYLVSRWGRDRVARIGTFGVSAAAGSLRSAGRVLDNSAVGAKLADTVPMLGGGHTASICEMLDPNFAPGAPFRAAVSRLNADSVIQIARGFEGAISYEGVHACGVVIGDDDLPGLVPLRRDRNSENAKRLVTEWDGKDIEEVGLLKMDVLGIVNLDGISVSVKLIKDELDESQRERFVDPEFVADDESDEQAGAAWDLLCQGRTAGLFQVDGAGMTALCRQVRPRSIEDLAAIVALYRPGPMGLGMHELYAGRKAGRETVSYDVFSENPDEVAVIKSVLDETYGIITYQEQLMKLGELIAGFDPIQRDLLRKAIGKKDKVKMALAGEQFLDGAVASITTSGDPKTPFAKSTAMNLWQAMQASGDYTFNKSHAVAYAKLTFMGAWVKANYPSEFAAGYLAVTDKDEKRQSVLASLAAEGVTVRSPDVNRSGVSTGLDPEIEPNGTRAIRPGLSEIKWLGARADDIVAERGTSGSYSSLADLVNRIEPKLSIREIGALITAGACDEFGPRMGMMMVAGVLHDHPDTPIPDCEWGVVERAAREYMSMGVLVSQSPLVVLRDQIKQWRSPSSSEKPVPLHRLPDTKYSICTIGVVAEFSIVKKKTRFARMRLAGSNTSVECVIWSKALDRLEQSGIPHVGAVVGVDARIQQRRIENSDEEDSEPKRELVVSNVWQGPLFDEARITLPSLPIPALS
ncbi:MAG: DNA polymerase III subunit alpha [Acidimicrobiales bacterium]